MDSLKKTTRRLLGQSSQPVRNVLVACQPGTGGLKVSIKLFDDKNLVGDATDNIERFRQQLETFFNELDKTTGLPTAIAQNLQRFTFEVTYRKGNPTEPERLAFGMMDFPVYIETTEDGRRPISENLAESLFRAHNIPAKTRVTLIKGPNETQRRTVDSYKELKEFIKDEDQRQLGMGIPGTYFNDAQTRCRKIGIIKMNLVIFNIVQDKREERLVLVLKHELGHMFGMDHEPDTLMDEHYKDLTLHPDFNVNQLNVMSQVLTILSQP